MRRAARQDANHTEIIKALRGVGCEVHDTSDVGGGFPDLVVKTPEIAGDDFKRPGRLLMVEVKDGRKPPSARKLTPAQEEFSKRWEGHWVCVTSVDEALAVVAGR